MFRLLLSLGVTACASTQLFGCASVPSFKPSRPIEQAKSLQEGLLLCNEYRIPAEPKRPVDLKPFLNCLDDIKDQFPAQAAGSQFFSTFRDEFHSMYGTLNDQAWTERLGIELDIAVHTALRALWQQDPPLVTPLERALFVQNFPTTAQRLGASSWKVASNVSLDPKLEQLKAGIAALSDAHERQEGSATTLGADASQETVLLCKRYTRLLSEASYLNGLWHDQYDFTVLVPQSPISAAVRQKYLAHLNAASHELEDLRPQISDARAKGRFRVLACRP